MSAAYRVQTISYAAALLCSVLSMLTASMFTALSWRWWVGGEVRIVCWVGGGGGYRDIIYCIYRGTAVPLQNTAMRCVVAADKKSGTAITRATTRKN